MLSPVLLLGALLIGRVVLRTDFLHLLHYGINIFDICLVTSASLGRRVDGCGISWF